METMSVDQMVFQLALIPVVATVVWAYNLVVKSVDQWVYQREMMKDIHWVWLSVLLKENW